MEIFWQCSRKIKSIFEKHPKILCCGDRSVIVRRQAIFSYTRQSIKLSSSVTSPTQVPLPDNKKTQKGDIHVPAEIRICSPCKRRPQTHDLERKCTGFSIPLNIIIIIGYRKIPQHDINKQQKTATLVAEHLLRKVLVYCTKCLWREIAFYVTYIVTSE